jgi:hypothetical protein
MFQGNDNTFGTFFESVDHFVFGADLINDTLQSLLEEFFIHSFDATTEK